MTKIIDITHALSPGIAVWPGDTEFKSQWIMRMDKNDSVNLGSVTMSLHTGTHADAPLHFEKSGKSIDKCDLSVYIGEALVIDAPDADQILPDHLEPLRKQKCPRALFRTGTASMATFTNDFSHFSKEAARELVQLGVKLVGIDTPSVDHAESKTLDAHHIFGASGVAILENLNLEHATPGRYELIALPLEFTGMDASPVRAILRLL